MLEPYAAKRDYASQAQRVVTGQRLMQATRDIFLGWHEGSLTGTQYYWRQLKDMKGSVDVATLDRAGLQTYLAVCSACREDHLPAMRAAVAAQGAPYGHNGLCSQGHESGR